MRTFGQMHSDCNRAGHPCSYWGERADWLVVSGQSRDSNVLEQSNFRSMLRELGGESDTVAVEREDHWAVGWVEHLLVLPGTPEAEKAEELRACLEDYPILDESDHSELEDEECTETWTNCFRPRERLEYIRSHGHCEHPDIAPLLRAVRGDWYEAANILNCPSDLLY